MEIVQNVFEKQIKRVQDVFEIVRKNIFSFKKDSMQSLQELENNINLEERRIEDICCNILNGKKFDREELVRIISFMKFNSNIEKTADHLKKINTSLEYLSMREMVFPLINVENIMKDVKKMFDDSIFAFLTCRKDVALEVISKDEEIDNIVWEEFLRVQEFIVRFPQSVKRCQNIIRILNYLERIGDICKNTGEYVLTQKSDKQNAQI
jgi:phosphate transport system protein